MDTDTETTPVETKGISRRAVIAGGAAGAAAFWSVPVIDSITQRAAAASGCHNTIGTISYVFVVYQNALGVHYAGTKSGTWGDQGTLKVNTTPQCTPECNGVTYGSNGFNGSPPAGGIYFNVGSSCLSSGTAIPYVSNPGSDLVVSGGTTKTITPGTGVTILAIFYFQAGSTAAVCGGGTGNNGQPCGITFG
jgi:hypothetical protein